MNLPPCEQNQKLTFPQLVLSRVTEADGLVGRWVFYRKKRKMQTTKCQARMGEEKDKLLWNRIFPQPGLLGRWGAAASWFQVNEIQVNSRGPSKSSCSLFGSCGGQELPDGAHTAEEGGKKTSITPFGPSKTLNPACFECVYLGLNKQLCPSIAALRG